MQHRTIEGPAGPIHLVEQGEGPLVLLVHGFPEGWSAWRRQLPALADAGLRAVAIDVRGYGDSARPEAVEAYRMTQLVADNVAVVRALGEQTAAIAGHDWGSPIAVASALMRPDVFTKVALLGVPHAPRPPMRPTEAFAHAGGDEEFYVSYFQEPGRAEAEMDADWLRGFYVALDGAGHERVFTIPPGGRMRDRFPLDAPLPEWLTEDELAEHARTFARTGFTGALNRYRNVDRDWEDLAAFDGRTIDQPAIYLAGEEDASIGWMRDAIDAHPQTLPGLRSQVLLAGAGHWIQQERPEEVNRLLVEWLRG